MALKNIFLDVGFYFREKEVARDHSKLMRNRASILSRVFAGALKTQPLLKTTFNTVGVFAATCRRGNYRIQRHKELKLGVAGPEINNLVDEVESSLAYQRLLAMVETAFLRDPSSLKDLLPALHHEYDAFEKAGFIHKWIRARRKPRGQKYEYLLEARLDDQAFSLFVQCRLGGTLVFEECIGQTSPFTATMLSGVAKSFELSDGQIALKGSIPTIIPPNELVHAKHGDVIRHHNKRLIHYEWSRDLQSILAAKKV